MHTKNIESTDEVVLQQPKIALNFVSSTNEDSDSEELEIEPMHICRPMTQLGFEAMTNLIVDNDDDTDCAEKILWGSNVGK